MDNRGKMLKNSINFEKDEFNRFLEVEDKNFIYFLDIAKVMNCIEKVIKLHKKNTIQNMTKLLHIPPSNGNYIHKISLKK